MGKLLLEGSPDGTKLMAAGRLTIQDASRLKDLLMEAYTGSEELFIDLREAESIDLACIQVLCSAHMTFEKARRPVHITEVIPEGVRRSLQDIAINIGSCRAGPSAQCFWAEGERDE
ncbi:MAG TPA: STAS domain-containing protein [Desulfomonilia bacterium]|nr:STAS domain-containing protein [Desulfomonilia bacterium]